RGSRLVAAVSARRWYAHAESPTLADASARFDAERVPFAMILSPAALPDDPHAVAVGLFELHDHHVVGKTRLPRHPAQFGATPASLTGNSPALGEHTDAILTELGLAAQISELRDAGVVA